jgi:hypothetical protein
MVTPIIIASHYIYVKLYHIGLFMSTKITKIFLESVEVVRSKEGMRLANDVKVVVAVTVVVGTVSDW